MIRKFIREISKCIVFEEFTYFLDNVLIMHVHNNVTLFMFVLILVQMHYFKLYYFLTLVKVRLDKEKMDSFL